VVARREETGTPESFAHRLAVPGETPLPETGQTVIASYLSGPSSHYPPPGSPEALLDADRLSGDLWARQWHPGDRLLPLGMSGAKKLQDLFVDRKIPRDKRSRIPVIADSEKIVWVAGVAISEIAKVTEHTTRWLRLRIEELADSK